MGISNNYWRDYWGNIRIYLLEQWKGGSNGKNNNIKLHSSLGKIVELEKLKYMKDFREKPSIYNKAGIEDY